jgi:uncharacterized repeat protein (TIGR01451 family)
VKSCSILRAALVAGAFLAVGPLAWAQANVQSELVAEKVARSATGDLARSPATSAKPGELVVYTARYRNVGKDAARALVLTVPVPPGMDYQGAQAAEKPVPTLASLDGKTYAPIPLTRKVRDAQGREMVQQVPLAEYRFLRWNVPQLAAGASVSVQLTAKVSE